MQTNQRMITVFPAKALFGERCPVRLPGLEGRIHDWRGDGVWVRGFGVDFSLSAEQRELPLVAFGTAAQQEAYLPRMTSGEVIGAHAMTEPGSGSDALHMSTRPGLAREQHELEPAGDGRPDNR
jgi:hypothetical protein